MRTGCVSVALVLDGPSLRTSAPCPAQHRNSVRHFRHHGNAGFVGVSNQHHKNPPRVVVPM